MNRLTRYHALAFMVLCLLVGAGLRFPDLPTIPPGLHYDEAANGILAADIGLRGDFSIFISSYTGKEVLFFYLAGGLMRLIGDSVFTLRLTAAFVGLLTVATTYWLGREMLADRRVALLAAALLAVSFWHLLFSRLGFRAITQPLLQALAVATLFRGLRRDDNRWLAMAGIFMGLAAYTYLAVRVFPILLLFTALPLLGNQLRRRQLLRVVGIALLIALPLLLYFINNPDAFWVRISQVAPDSPMTQLSLQESFIRSFGMFFLEGDPFWRFNLPGRPLLNWFWGGLLIVGWLIGIWRWRRFPYDWQRSAIILLTATPLVMILPTALATGEIVPSNLRAIGLIPFIFYLPATGIVILFHDLEKRFGRPPVTFAVMFTGLLILLSGGLSTMQAYFEQWAVEPTLFYEADGDLTAVAQFLDQTELTDKTIYVAAPHYKHPTVAFLSDAYEAVKWLPQSSALVFPADENALIIYPHNSPAPSWTNPYLADAATYPGTASEAFKAYDVVQMPEISVTNAINVNFGDTITLLGSDVTPGESNGTLPVTLFWQVENQPQAAYTPFIHLEDAWGFRWSQVETFAYPAEQWAAGETIIQRVDVPLQAGMPPGKYRLRVGLFEGANETRLPLLDDNGRYAGDAIIIENAEVGNGPMPDDFSRPSVSFSDTVRPGLRLLGYERGPVETTTGAPWGLGFWWQAREALPPMTLEMVLVDENGNGRVIHSSQPVHDTFPFEEWSLPQFLIDRHTIRVPDNVAEGLYQLELHVLNEAEETIYERNLGPLTIEQTVRQFTTPAIDDPVNAIFGDQINLLGSNMTTGEDGATSLSLIWQAIAPPDTDYTVFVHVLHGDGRCCAWQQDVMPQQNQYPTSRWLTDEIITDTYEITLPDELPPGEYAVEVGLYIAETGQRLQAVMSDGNTGDAQLLPNKISGR